MSNYKFTMDFNYDGGAKQNITEIINKFGLPNTYIEVGVFEGGTTFWLSDSITPHNKNFKLYTIDPHDVSDDMSENLKDIKNNFMHNLNQNKFKNITHIPKYSDDGLIDLINQNVKAELIYIDGDHTASVVMSDLVLAFRLLVRGGVILCDDSVDWKFKDNNNFSAAQLSPRMAVESFIQCNWHKLQPLRLSYGSQTAFIKL